MPTSIRLGLTLTARAAVVGVAVAALHGWDGTVEPGTVRFPADGAWLDDPTVRSTVLDAYTFDRHTWRYPSWATIPADGLDGMKVIRGWPEELDARRAALVDCGLDPDGTLDAAISSRGEGEVHVEIFTPLAPDVALCVRSVLLRLPFQKLLRQQDAWKRVRLQMSDPAAPTLEADLEGLRPPYRLSGSLIWDFFWALPLERVAIAARSESLGSFSEHRRAMASAMHTSASAQCPSDVPGEGPSLFDTSFEADDQLVDAIWCEGAADRTEVKVWFVGATVGRGNPRKSEHIVVRPPNECIESKVRADLDLLGRKAVDAVVAHPRPTRDTRTLAVGDGHPVPGAPCIADYVTMILTTPERP